MRNKQRLLYLYRYLLRYTDDEHQATTNELVSLLRKKGMSSGRKTVKDDIEMLVEEDMDVVTSRNHSNSYFIGNRLFEVPEVKILADMAAANRSLTGEQKRKLIDKLFLMLSVYQEEKLRKSFLHPTGGSEGSERLYYTVDRIMDAVSEGKKVRFRYPDHLTAGKQAAKKGQRICIVTPCAVTYSDNRVYMLGYVEASVETGLATVIGHGAGETGPAAVYGRGAGENSSAAVNGRGTVKDCPLSVFCVDRMNGTEILEESGERQERKRGKKNPTDIPQAPPASDNLEREEFVNSLFGMQSGPMAEVVLECNNSLKEEVMDRFGSFAEIWKSTQTSFYVKAHVSISDAFYAWVFRHRGRIRIVSPGSVAEGYGEMLREALQANR